MLNLQIPHSRPLSPTRGIFSLPLMSSSESVESVSSESPTEEALDFQDLLNEVEFSLTTKENDLNEIVDLVKASLGISVLSGELSASTCDDTPGSNNFALKREVAPCVA